MSELKKIALRAVVGSLNPQEPGQLLVGSSKRNSGSIFGVSVWRGSVVAWQSSTSTDLYSTAERIIGDSPIYRVDSIQVKKAARVPTLSSWFVHLRSENMETRANKALIIGKLMDKRKRFRKNYVSNIFLSKQNICASRGEARPFCSLF